MSPGQLVQEWVSRFNQADSDGLAALYSPGGLVPGPRLEPAFWRRCLTMRFMMAAALATVAAVTGEGAPQGNAIQQLAWLQGCWETTSAGRTVEELWTAPRGRSMVGLSRTVRGEQLAEYELIVIRERGGRLIYIAHPSGQPSAEFLSTSLSEDSAVFENPGHDFPQRIGYRRHGPSLQAWIEGTKDGQARRIEFPYRRAVCAAD